MHSDLSQKFSSGSFLLVRKVDDSVVFLGTAFLVHEEGYLLTAAHLIGNESDDLLVAPAKDPDEFSALSLDQVAALAVTTVAVDRVHNVALLRFVRNIQVDAPDHLLGSIDNVSLGDSVLGFGFPFGHQDLHNLAVQRGMVSSKASLGNGTRLLLVDCMIHDGMSGGPLVAVQDGRAVGILVGRFTPDDEGGDFARGTDHPDYHTAFSYAVSIEYGIRLLEDQGVEIN
ncbi:MAG: serine protease [Spirochaetales bacterium]|nr:serine protease [Spirochaetales bacterium]